MQDRPQLFDLPVEHLANSLIGCHDARGEHVASLLNDDPHAAQLRRIQLDVNDSRSALDGLANPQRLGDGDGWRAASHFSRRTPKIGVEARSQ